MYTESASVVVKRNLSQKVKLSIYWSIFVPTLTYGQEFWIVTTTHDNITDTNG